MDITLLLIGVLSLIIAATMSVLAWRVLRDDRLRSSRRVAALAAEIHAGPIAAREHVAPPATIDEFVPERASPVTGEMFRAMPPRSPLPLVATVAAIIVGLAAAGTILLGGDTSRPVAAQPPSRGLETAGEGAARTDRARARARLPTA